MKPKAPKAAANDARSPLIRVAKLTNPATKREVFERVTSDGRLSARAAKHLGVKRVKAWIEVEATRWKQATAAIRAGKGKRVRAA